MPVSAHRLTSRSWTPPKVRKSLAPCLSVLVDAGGPLLPRSTFSPSCCLPRVTKLPVSANWECVSIIRRGAGKPGTPTFKEFSLLHLARNGRAINHYRKADSPRLPWSSWPGGFLTPGARKSQVELGAGSTYQVRIWAEGQLSKLASSSLPLGPGNGVRSNTARCFPLGATYSWTIPTCPKGSGREME